MNKITIPKPSPPSVSEFSHSSVGLEWTDFYQKLKNAVHIEKILSELTICEEKSKEWKRIYIGYAANHKADNLKPVFKYAFRLRFKIKEEWSQYSDPVIVTTLEPPMTGENIHKAIRNQNVIELERVLVQGKVNIEAQNNLGFTPLMVASQDSMTDIMELLIKKGCDIEAKTDSGKTSLMLSSFKGEWKAIEMLIKHGANLNNTDRSNLTAMHYAVDGESSRAVRILGASGAVIDALDSVLRWSPLMRCAGLKNNGNVDIAKDLIKLGADVNLADKEGNSALSLAVINGHVKLCDLLISNGADIHSKNKNKHSVFKIANSNDNMAIKQLFNDANEMK